MELFSLREKIILRELSNDSRASLSGMSKLAGCSYVTVSKIINKLIEKLDIKFVLELDFARLGFLQRHVLMIKFSKKPSREWLNGLLKNEHTVDSAYLTTGQFDLVIFVVESDPMKYMLWEFLLTQKLSEYGVEIRSSVLPYLSFGYIPAPEALFDAISIKMKKGDIELLKLLNANSRLGFNDLAKHLKTGESTVRYKLFRLVKSGIIKRFTIAVQKPPNSYTIAFFEQWTRYTSNFEEKAAQERKLTMTIDKDMPLLNTFQMSANLSGSFGNFTVALFDSQEEALENTIEFRQKIYRTESYSAVHARIISPLKGLLPFRNLDIKNNYNVVKWESHL